MKHTLAALLAALVLATCGGDSSGDDASPADEATEDVPSCGDAYTPGQPTADVVAAHNADDITGGCVADDGTLLLAAMTSFDCTPAAGARRTVHMVDEWGWGFADDVWQPAGSPKPYTDCVPAGTDAQHP